MHTPPHCDDDAGDQIIGIPHISPQPPRRFQIVSGTIFTEAMCNTPPEMFAAMSPECRNLIIEERVRQCLFAHMQKVHQIITTHTDDKPQYMEMECLRHTNTLLTCIQP